MQDGEERIETELIFKDLYQDLDWTRTESTLRAIRGRECLIAQNN